MTTSTSATEELQHQAELLRAHLLSQLGARRLCLDLTQAEVAARMGRTRMTVQRGEAEGGNIALGSFVELALALGLTPRLLEAHERVDRVEDAEGISPHPAHVVHRGYHHNRTRHDLSWDDRKREAALAQSWEAANKPAAVGLAPIMESMVPNHSQAQASAVATAIQWLGSEVGFEFLSRALANAGYVIEKAPAKGRKG